MKLKSPEEEQETDFTSNMPNWYYDRRELRETPSITDGIEYDTEQRYRKEGARFIINVGTRMGLRYDTMATGVVYFHRFYMFHSFRTFPRFVTASCCLFLAGKVEETPKKCKDIIKTAQTLLTEQQFAQFGEDPKEEVMTLERILLQTIKFDLQVDHPYGYLLKYAKSLKGDKAKLQKLVQMAWTFINDSLCTTLCLQWEPEIIGIALMYLAGKLSKFEVTDWNGRTSKHNHWWDMFVENMNTEFLEDICHQVLDLYSSPLPTTPQDSPPATPPPPKQNRKSLGSSQKNSPTSPVSSTTTPPCQPKLKEQISAKNTPTVKSEVSPPAASPPKMSNPTTPGTPIASTTPKASATPNASATTLPAQIPSLPSITLTVPTVATEPAPVIPVVQPDSSSLPVFATGMYDWSTSTQPLPSQTVPLESANVYHSGEYSQNREQLVGEPDSKFRKDQIHFPGFDTIKASPVPTACIKGHTALPPPQPNYINQVSGAYPPGFVEKHGKLSELPYYPAKTPPPDSQYPSFQLPPQYYRTSDAQDQYYSHIHHASSQQASYRPSPNAMIPSHRSRPASPLPQHLLSKGTLPPPPPSVPPSLFQEQYVNRSLHGRSQYHNTGPSSYPPHHAPLPPSLPSHRSGMNPNMPPLGLYRYSEHASEPPMQHLPFEENSGSLPHGRILGRF